MTLVEMYSKDGCHLCEEAKAVIEKVRGRIPFTFREIKLMAGDALFDEYKELFPVIHINKTLAFKYRVTENLLKLRLEQEGERTKARTEEDEPTS
jgi:glutaredoxin